MSKSRLNAIKNLHNAHQNASKNLMHEHEKKVRAAKSIYADNLTEVYGQWIPFWNTVDFNFDSVSNKAKDIYFSYAGKDFKPDISDIQDTGHNDHNVIPESKRKESLRRNSSIEAKKYKLPQDITQILNDGRKSAKAALAGDAREPKKISFLTEPKRLEAAFKAVENRLNDIMRQEFGPGYKSMESHSKIAPVLRYVFSLRHRELRLLRSELQTQYRDMLKQFAKEKKERNNAQVKQMEFLNKLMSKKATGHRNWK